MRKQVNRFLTMLLTGFLTLCFDAAADPWHTYHGDFALTGAARHDFPAKPSRLWKTRVGTVLPSAVTGGDGRVFCIADDKNVIALSTEGEKLWSRTFEVPSKSPGKIITASFTAPPLYVHESLLAVASDFGQVYGLNPKDGATIWEYKAKGRIQGSPNIVFNKAKDEAGRIVVITKEEGVIHAMHATDGKPIWKSERLERTDGHIAADDGMIVLGNCTSSFIAIDAVDGKTLSVVNVGKECEMAGGVAASKAQAFAGNRSGSFAAVDLNAEKLIWRHRENEGEVFTTPALTSERVVFLGSDAVMHCLDRSSGRKHWSKTFRGYIPLSPVIAGTTVIAGLDGDLFGLKLSDGKQVWSLNIGDEISQPAVIDEMIIVGIDDGCVAAYGKDNSK